MKYSWSEFDFTPSNRGEVLEKAGELYNNIKLTDDRDFKDLSVVEDDNVVVVGIYHYGEVQLPMQFNREVKETW